MKRLFDIVASGCGLHTRLTDEDVEYVIGNFCEFISK